MKELRDQMIKARREGNYLKADLIKQRMNALKRRKIR